jgi:multicomponent Na+:H+ antiporter subunit F
MSFESVTVNLVMTVMVVSIVLSFVRLARGPSLADRVVALDLISTISIGLIAVYSIATDETAFLDVAIILALISFLGTIAFAYYLERRIQK